MLSRCGWVGDSYALVRRVVVAWEEVEWLWMLWADEWMWMRYHLSQRVQGGSQGGQVDSSSGGHHSNYLFDPPGAALLRAPILIAP